MITLRNFNQYMYIYSQYSDSRNQKKKKRKELNPTENRQKWSLIDFLIHSVEFIQASYLFHILNLPIKGNK